MQIVSCKEWRCFTGISLPRGVQRIPTERLEQRDVLEKLVLCWGVGPATW